ncbi:heterokaryon incompatibility protein-domain-containing protein [Leptodontidium sp. MPI-SDFR-AT-0119]|nr:heterokaryon incompatibility protein-domain-containing protein [Leptodontidium sp. MPI-SDFR-AT-0119]
MPETIDVTSSFVEVFEGRDNDRLEVYKQNDRDRSDALHSQAQSFDSARQTVNHVLRSRLEQEVSAIHGKQWIELLDETQRKDRHEPYTYSRLPSSRHIRLLQLEDKFETFRQWSILAGQLITVKIDEAPEYDALSYTWGTREQTVPVLIGDRRILVTPNLAVVLQYMRASKEDGLKRWLWIDQICINQEDLAERAQQVQLMREIYEKSAETTIWLGLNQQLLRRLEDRLFSKVWPYVKDDVRNSLLPDLLLATKRPADIPKYEDDIWKDLAHFLDRAWFRRIWVVQEARVSSNKSSVNVRLANSRIGWHNLALVMTWLVQKGFTAIHKDLKPMVNVARIFNYGKTRMPLLRQLQETRSFEASDARDKVFALAGLVLEGKEQDKLPECLMPDYTKSPAKVYQATTVYLIKQTMDLQVLSYVQHVTADIAEDIDLPTAKVPTDEMPSWVARWESEHNTGSHIIDAPFFNAAAGKSLDLKIIKKQSALKVKGLRFDKINYVSRIFQNSSWTLMDEAKFALGNPLFESWRQINEKLDRGNPTGGVRDEIIYVAMLCGKRLTGERATPNDQMFLSFLAYLHCSFIMSTCYESFKRLGLLDHHSSILERVKTTDNPISRAKPGSMTLHLHQLLGNLGQAGGGPNTFMREMNCTQQRKLFTTTSGYVGMGPAAMKEDDIVVILYGGRVPFVLRPRDEHFYLVGECYVHGIMDGVGVKIATEKGVVPQYFELR